MHIRVGAVPAGISKVVIFYTSLDVFYKFFRQKTLRRYTKREFRTLFSYLFFETPCAVRPIAPLRSVQNTQRISIFSAVNISPRYCPFFLKQQHLQF